ncbi:MAG: fimbrillin family protein [Dysgonamonadaceae bacterium]|jgi:endonuclease G|nr:fimbrillin family protein [Dysgonamonadaceae bacterium]
MKTGFLSVFAISVLLFVSCNKDDKEPEVNDGRVEFSSGLIGLHTKVSGDNGISWDGDETIGIYMMGHETSDVVENAENVEYTNSLAGATATFTSTTPIYYPVNVAQKVDFIAYHPYNEDLQDEKYLIDLSDQTDQSAIDLMSALTIEMSAPSGYDKTNTDPVNLKFKHQLVKVIINVIAGDGVIDLTGLDVEIVGMNTSADFDLTGKEGISNETIISNISPYKQPGAYTYEIILLPVTLSGSHVVKFALDQNIYTWTINDNDNKIVLFEGGKKYAFNVTLNKNEVQVTGEIEPWDPEDGGDVIAK